MCINCLITYSLCDALILFILSSSENTQGPIYKES